MPSEAKSNEKIAQKPCVLENKSCEMYTKPNPSCINFTRKNQTSKKNKCNKWNEVYLICKNKENPRPTFQNFQPSMYLLKMKESFQQSKDSRNMSSLGSSLALEEKPFSAICCCCCCC